MTLLDIEWDVWYIFIAFKEKKMRKKVILICEDCLSRNYTVEKNTASQKRLELKKYCAKCGKHTLHKETK